MENYIELQKIRSADKGEISFTHTTDKTQTMIAPLLLIILLENAFKHGFEKLAENKIINLILCVNASKLIFHVENTFKAPTENEVKENAGIGLDNLSKRLDLIYPERHNLFYLATDDIYKATLEIDLSQGEIDLSKGQKSE